MRKKINVLIKKLKALLQGDLKKIKGKKDSLDYMGKLRKKVQKMIDDAEKFIKKIHKTNPFADSDSYLDELETLHNPVIFI